MKITQRLFLVILLTFCSTVLANAQPRALGIRGGATGVEVSYQHSFSSEQFLNIDTGLDFGYNVSGHLGAKVTGIYNFVWSQPKWTNKGTWKLYAGPGISTGWKEDRVVVKVGEERANAFCRGFMIALVGQVGMEYSFDIPLQISLEIRPCVGMHLAESGLNFYDNGLLGFAPSLGVRYNF